MRQGSRGLLLHRHCVALAGRPRTHVAVQPSSGLRSIAMMYTKLLHSITYLMFFSAEHCHDVHETASFNHISNVFCVMKVADRLNSDLLSSVSTLQITVLFDHRRPHHHHFLCVFRIPFRLTWTHKVQASTTWVRKVSEHSTTTLHTFSIVFFVFLVLAQIGTHTFCACWHMFVRLPFAATCSFLDQLFLDCFCQCSAAAQRTRTRSKRVRRFD